VEKAINELDKNLNEEGIFRIPGTTDKVNKIKESYNAGQSVDFSTIDAHSVAGALKLFFREVPDLLTKDQKVKIDAIVDIEDDKPRQITELREILKTFNPFIKETFQALIAVNSRISKNQTVTKMNSLNLATVWSATLKCNAEFILILVDHYDAIFLDPQVGPSISITVSTENQEKKENSQTGQIIPEKTE